MSASAVTTPSTVLSMDGGGLHGIIPAVYLAEIEQRTGKSVSELFDLIGGTSAGGINAVTLRIPDGGSGEAAFTAQDLVELYIDHASTIFPRTLKATVRKMVTCCGWGMPKYNRSGLISVLDQYKGDSRMADLLGEVAVLSERCNGDGPVIFSRELAREEDSGFNELTVSQVLCAATAAPGLFSAYPMELNGTTVLWTDGGVVDDDPVTLDFDLLAGTKGWDPNTVCLSIGTGRAQDAGVSTFTARCEGRIGWVSPYYRLHQISAQEEQDMALGGLLGDNYFRFQVTFEGDGPAIDDSRSGTMTLLYDVAREGVERDDDSIRELCKKIAPRSI